MKVNQLSLSGVFEIVSDKYCDSRGYFFEGFVQSKLWNAIGIDFDPVQMNVSSSIKGTIRGIHFSTSSVGQAKYVQCLEGKIIDVIVDLNPDSPTFKQSIQIELDSDVGNAVYIPSGYGHSFQALSDTALVVYLCSSDYDPTHEMAINPLDSELNISWPILSAIMSDKDKGAMSLREYLL